MGEANLKQLMIMQGDSIVTVPAGGVPVLEYGSGPDVCMLATIVNFLRCGCPAVQVVAEGNPDEYRWSRLDEFLSVVAQATNERFIREETVSSQTRTNPSGYHVATIRREEKVDA